MYTPSSLWKEKSTASTWLLVDRVDATCEFILCIICNITWFKEKNANICFEEKKGTQHPDGGAGIWTQDPCYAKAVLCHWATPPTIVRLLATSQVALWLLFNSCVWCLFCPPFICDQQFFPQSCVPCVLLQILPEFHHLIQPLVAFLMDPFMS